jgi:hypothetical protein
VPLPPRDFLHGQARSNRLGCKSANDGLLLQTFGTLSRRDLKAVAHQDYCLAYLSGKGPHLQCRTGVTEAGAVRVHLPCPRCRRDGKPGYVSGKLSGNGRLEQSKWHGVGVHRNTTMHLLCAWCRQEGKPGYLDMLEPLENPELTHGICAGHKEQLLQSIPSRSFPDAELLIVVHRNYIELYEHLARWVAGAPVVKVLMDRRATDRRSATCPVVDERRVRTRRIRQGTISPQGGYTVMRFTPNVSHSP